MSTERLRLGSAIVCCVASISIIASIPLQGRRENAIGFFLAEGYPVFLYFATLSGLVFIFCSLRAASFAQRAVGAVTGLVLLLGLPPLCLLALFANPVNSKDFVNFNVFDYVNAVVSNTFILGVGWATMTSLGRLILSSFGSRSASNK